MALVLPIAILTGLAGVAMEKYELSHYGKKAYAIILEHHNFNNKNGKYTLADISYIANNKNFMGSIEDDNYRYKKNDTVIIIFSSRDPLVYKMAGAKINGVDQLLP